MSTVPVRELNQQTAAVLARVKSGEQIEITERGVVVAVLAPPSPNPLTDLIGAGKVVPATQSGPLPGPTGPMHDDSSDLLREMREDERY